MVAATPYQMEWTVPSVPTTRPGYRNGCLSNRLGGILSGSEDRWTMVSDRTTETHKLSGAVGSHASSEVLCQRQSEYQSPSKNGQHDSPYIHKQIWRDCFSGTESPDKRTMAMVPRQEHFTPCHPPSWCAECHSGRGVPCDERPDRLDALSSDIQDDQPIHRATTSRPVCIPPDSPTQRLCELETRPRGNGDRRLFSRLECTPGVCKSTMESGRQSSNTGQEPESPVSVSSTSVEITGVVSNTARNVDPGTPPAAKQARFDPTDSQSQQARHNASTGRLGYLRSRFQDQKLSGEASKLLLASWRQKTSKSYDSLFNKWLGWCSERDSNPISGDISEVVNFLAHLFEKGYQYRSLNSYRSAISSVHEKVDGYEVGQHPLVTRLIKGAFHERPPQPRYSETWDVSKVTAYYGK